ncbi:uncharacterized protein KY384_003059 [Bacidia gigantensis]|uniref:uncharacterized protein n=1 Tax=Bacidia gigantensis TaxID=2732470 RepID=UPI001D03D2CF|nr:uncharacterized protein KY384_003059 [Bacidia gigantensis]KAG8531430.1 hypothetical protein KY384_003059 [Bacidia gigantensis]
MFGARPKGVKSKQKKRRDGGHSAPKPSVVSQETTFPNGKARSTTSLNPSRPSYINGPYNANPAADTTTTFPAELNHRGPYENAQMLPNLPCQHDSSSLSSVYPISSTLIKAHDDSFLGTFNHTISSKLDEVLTAIDEETFTGEERDLVIPNEPATSLRGGGHFFSKKSSATAAADRAITSTIATSNVFAKATLYANSKLPLHLPPLQLYLPAYPLICLAAQYSRRAYSKATTGERDAFIGADWRLGTKAMVIKSIAVDEQNTIVFAIRGSQTFMDWAVNLHTNPEPPEGFLDDVGNLCHSGFLSVARKMMKPVAARLRSLLEENPARSTCSLLMTGHSAGGAIATLLYAHMLAETEGARSELNILTGAFRRIHCLTFGTPPISLLPLEKPSAERYKKSLFFSFINEGDPVPRADPAYIGSLLRLYASPAPEKGKRIALPDIKLLRKRQQDKAKKLPLTSQDYVWDVPPGTLSNAGKLVGLKGEPGPRVAAGNEEDVKAVVLRDYDLRGVVFGDPVMHMMNVYARRVEVLATKAVTGGLWHEA